MTADGSGFIDGVRVAQVGTQVRLEIGGPLAPIIVLDCMLTPEQASGVRARIGVAEDLAVKERDRLEREQDKEQRKRIEEVASHFPDDMSAFAAWDAAEAILAAYDLTPKDSPAAKGEATPP